jgi:hypothetical protein
MTLYIRRVILCIRSCSYMCGFQDVSYDNTGYYRAFVKITIAKAMLL